MSDWLPNARRVLKEIVEGDCTHVYDGERVTTDICEDCQAERIADLAEQAEEVGRMSK